MNRNQLCRCGSGKRYKQCCGAVASSTSLDTGESDPEYALRRNPFDTLYKALSAQQEGRLASSERLYHAALQAIPGHFDALHMLGVVKLQLGKFEEATRLLLAAFPLVPDSMHLHFKHNLVLSLNSLARERGMLAALTQEPEQLARPAPFVRPYAISDGATAARVDISVIVTGVTTPSMLAHTLEGLGNRSTTQDLEVVAVVRRDGASREVLHQALNRYSASARLIVAEDPSPAAQLNAATAACTGESLCFLRAGDRWSPHWLERMMAAVRYFGAQWGYSGIRIINDKGSIVHFGTAPDADALLRAQDELYLHRTPSLAFLAYNPVAAGRNLIVKRALWFSRGGIASEAADPFLDWAWRTSQCEEPVYLDDPAYLIPAGTEGIHLHNSGARLISATVRSKGETANRYLQHGIALFWARQWQAIRSLRDSAISSDVFLGCVAMLGVEQAPPAMVLAA